MGSAFDKIGLQERTRLIRHHSRHGMVQILVRDLVNTSHKKKTKKKKEEEEAEEQAEEEEADGEKEDD